MESEVRKHKYLPILIAVFVMLLVTTIAVGGVWYYMDQQAKKAANDNAKQVAELQKQIDDLKGTEKTLIDLTASWKVYTDKEYSIKYPTSWYLTSATIQSWAPTTNGAGGLAEGMSKIDLHGLDSYSGITSSVLKTAVDQVIAEWKQGNIDRGNTSFTVKSTEKLTVNNEEAYLVVTHSTEAGSATLYTLYVMDNGLLRSIAVVSGEIPTVTTDKEIRLLINTFKLV